MKILFVHPRLSVLGGAERVLIHTLRALRNNELSLIADRWNPEDITNIIDIEPPRVEWIKCSSFRPIYQHLTAFQWLYYTRKINRLIQKISEDHDLVIETQQVYSDAPSDTPLINYIHYPTLAAPPPEEEQSLTSSIYYAVTRFFIRKRVKKISLALTNSQFTAKKIVEYLGINPLVVYPPVDVKKFHSERTWSGREDKVITIGMFLPFKRHHLLLKVAKELPKVKFVIIGTVSEDYRSYYERLCMQKPNNVIIKQNLTFNEVKHELATAKAYVHLCPEHFGISPIEAAAAGCVPIIYQVGGPAESLGDAALMWQDLPQLSTHISKLLKDKDLWSELSKRARDKAFEFDASVFEQRIRNIIEKQLWR